MSKKGMTLIEIVVSIGILTIIIVSTMNIFAKTIRNIDANGKSINSMNSSLTELDKAIFDPNYASSVSTLTQEDLYMFSVGSVLVPTRFIKSDIEDKNGYGTITDKSSFVYCLPTISLISDTKAIGFKDKNNNGINNNETTVYVSDIKNGYSSTNSDGFAFISGNEYNFDFDVNIDVAGNIYANNVKFTSTGTITLKGKNIYIDASTITTNNRITLEASESIVINNGTRIISGDEFIIIKTKEAIIYGESNKRVYLLSNKEVNFDISEDGIIQLGNKNISDTETYVTFKGSVKKGEQDFGWNKNNVSFNTTSGINPERELIYFR